MFEALPVAGGMLRVGIPDHRMPQDVLQREIDQICALGVDLRVNQRCGTDFTVDGLLEQGYKAVFLAPGLQTSAPAPVKGDDLEGCVPAVEFLRELNLGRPMPVGDRVVVVGGGDVAFDSARAALRLTSVNGKAPEATIAYRRTREEMPATIEEIEEGLAEGVKIEFLAAPVEVIGSGGKVSAVKFQRNRLGEPDEKGRRRPEPIPGAFFEVPCETVIFAVGQAIVDDFAAGADGLTIDRGAVCTSDALVTTRPGVFAGGDAAPQGPLTAINAIAAGRKAAASIHNYLRGNQVVPLEMEPMAEARPTEDELAAVTRAPRLAPAEQPGGQRRRNWSESPRDLHQRRGHRRSPALSGLRSLLRMYAVRQSLLGRRRTPRAAAQRDRPGRGQHHPDARVRGVPGRACAASSATAATRTSCPACSSSGCCRLPGPPAARSFARPTGERSNASRSSSASAAGIPPAAGVTARPSAA